MTDICNNIDGFLKHYAKRSQTQMVIFFFIPFKLSSRKDKTIVTESKSGIAQARNKVGD